MEQTLGGLWAWRLSSDQDWAIRLKLPAKSRFGSDVPGVADVGGLGDIKLATSTAFRVAKIFRLGGGLDLEMPTGRHEVSDNFWRIQNSPPAAGVISKLRDADAARKVAAWIIALGGPVNIERVDDCAAARRRVVLRSEAGVDESALGHDGIDAVVRLPGNTLHLLVGLNADQYAAEMQAQRAAREAA